MASMSFSGLRSVLDLRFLGKPAYKIHFQIQYFSRRQAFMDKSCIVYWCLHCFGVFCFFFFFGGFFFFMNSAFFQWILIPQKQDTFKDCLVYKTDKLLACLYYNLIICTCRTFSLLIWRPPMPVCCRLLSSHRYSRSWRYGKVPVHCHSIPWCSRIFCKPQGIYPHQPGENNARTGHCSRTKPWRCWFQTK